MTEPVQADILEQKAREWRKERQNLSTHPVYAGGFWSDEKVASFAREIVEQAAKAICQCCGKYSDGWNPPIKEGISWIHTSKAHQTRSHFSDHKCDAAAIWEAFGGKQ